ncbi:hypothetical protein PFISCL1PPCAC_9715 [Pristionchus fissidentatus]|uniref:G protein-coupled receptor n=1 Tax=Pristionchus fissidentatus TaxID=1538716 RepID=A0AAV5VJF6_9BILA|nr:hypothetical protein PFISCL1PPCAC_9715 [Pristionchus fissidentatus]
MTPLLSLAWSLLSLSLGLLQLLVLTQPEWIVHGGTSMGLFALCAQGTCVLRSGAAALPLLAHFAGGLLFLVSALLLCPLLLCSSSAKPIRLISNVQLVAAVLCGITVIFVPLDMADVDCALPELLRSSTCRVGWAYAVSSVCALLSMCCPVLGRLGRGRSQRVLTSAMSRLSLSHTHSLTLEVGIYAKRTHFQAATETRVEVEEKAIGPARMMVNKATSYEFQSLSAAQAQRALTNARLINFLKAALPIMEKELEECRLFEKIL